MRREGRAISAAAMYAGGDGISAFSVITVAASAAASIANIPVAHLAHASAGCLPEASRVVCAVLDVCGV